LRLCSIYWTIEVPVSILIKKEKKYRIEPEKDSKDRTEQSGQENQEKKHDNHDGQDSQDTETG
jgi:hypothetical protein